MSAKEQRELNNFQIWWLAIRPRTLPAAASGVVMGSALGLGRSFISNSACTGGFVRGFAFANWKQCGKRCL